MERRVLIAVILSLGVLFVYPHLLEKFYPENPRSVSVPAVTEEARQVSQVYAEQIPVTPSTTTASAWEQPAAAPLKAQVSETTRKSEALPPIRSHNHLPSTSNTPYIPHKRTTYV